MGTERFATAKTMSRASSRASGTFTTFGTNFRQNPSNTVAADFNGDGKLDLAGFSFVDYGTGDGRFNSIGGTTNFTHVLRTVAVGGSFPLNGLQSAISTATAHRT
jgi:hypothetical protein